MKQYLSFILLGTIVQYGPITWAYETPTHDQISRVTVQESDLNQDIELLPDIGLDFTVLDPALPSEVPLVDPNDPSTPNPDKTEFREDATILDIIAGGAVLEDHGTTPINHFYDPLHDLSSGSTFAIRSPEWVLELNDAGVRIQHTSQSYSFMDAVDYFFEALSLPLSHRMLTHTGFQLI